MRKKHSILFILAIFSILFIPTACADESQAPADEKFQAEKKFDTPDVLVIHDFERGDMDHSNNLGGQSGGWNMDPMDINNSYCDTDVVETTGADGNPTKAMMLTYSVESEVPSSNGWWTKLGNLDGSTHEYLYLDIKGDSEKGYSNKFKVQLKKFKPHREGEMEDYTEEKIKSSFEVYATDEWETMKIPLNKMTGLIDFANPEAWQNPAIGRKDLDEFVIVFQDRHVSKKQGRVYIDNIRFVRTGEKLPTAVDFPPQTREKTPTRIEGLEFQKFLMGRLGGFPEKSLVKKEFPENQREFFMEIARDTWRFFAEIVDQEHGLVLDTIQTADGEDAVGEGMWIGDYTNVTNIGVYFMCLVAGYELGFVSRAEAVKMAAKTMNNLENNMEYHASGFPYNYYDTTLSSRTSYFVSVVDSGWLVAGLYVAKNAFAKELGEQAQRLIDRGNLVFFYDTVERQMFHGYYEHLEVYSDYHYGVFYSEPRATSYISIAQGKVPVDHWYGGLIRTFSKNFEWQAQTPINQVEKEALGYKYTGGYYEWKGIKFVPSWGGSSFEALMPTLVIKERELAPEGLGLNNARHVEGMIKFALQDEKMPVWGMSPSAIPEGGYSEYGATPFGSKGYKPGVVTPHASVLAIEYNPDAVEKNLRYMIENYDMYGEYGFYDAVRPETGKVIRRYLALDQGMILTQLANYLKDGVIRKHFHNDPVLKQGEKLLTSEKLFE